MTSLVPVCCITFDHYGPHKGGLASVKRQNGVLISNATGKATTFACSVCKTVVLFIGHATEVYEGQVIGIHSCLQRPDRQLPERQTADQHACLGTDEARC